MLKIVTEGTKLENHELKDIYGKYSDECGQSCATSCPYGAYELLMGYHNSHEEWSKVSIV